MCIESILKYWNYEELMELMKTFVPYVTTIINGKMNISSIGDNHNDGGERNLDSIISTINSKNPHSFVFFNDIYYILSHFFDIINLYFHICFLAFGRKTL